MKVIGPGEPMVAKIRNQYLMSILLKITRGKGDLQQIKDKVQSHVSALSLERDFRNVRFVVDVDPV